MCRQRFNFSLTGAWPNTEQALSSDTKCSQSETGADHFLPMRKRGFTSTGILLKYHNSRLTALYKPWIMNNMATIRIHFVLQLPTMESNAPPSPSRHRWGHVQGFDQRAVNGPAYGAESMFKCCQIPCLAYISYIFTIWAMRTKEVYFVIISSLITGSLAMRC